MKPLDCAETEPLLVDLADERLDADQVDRIDEHLASCQACAALLSDLRRSGTLLEQIREDQESELASVTKKPVRVANAPHPLRPLRRARKLVAALAVAAAMALIVTVTWDGGTNQPEPLQLAQTTSAPAQQEFDAKTQAAEIQRLRQHVQAEGAAARLLAAADMLNAVNGGRDYAVESYRNITENYANTRAGKTARERLADAEERNTP